METVSSIISNISDKKSELSISLESNDVTTHERHFSWVSWIIPRVSSLSFIALLVYWIMTEQNGFIYKTPSIITPSSSSTANGYLGYHALGLSIWAVVANQETIMAFAIPLSCASSSYQTRKYIHVISQIIGFLCGVGGMVSILWYKNSSASMPISGTSFTLMDNPYYIPYSPHAWLGALFMLSWIVQGVGRFFPTYITVARHRFLGRFTYVVGLVCCCLGLQQQQTRQLTMNLQQLALNQTSVSNPSGWWFSQPSLGVLLLGIIGGATFLYGLL
jgi:Eukaryotic cytochrome b561